MNLKWTIFFDFLADILSFINYNFWFWFLFLISFTFRPILTLINLLFQFLLDITLIINVLIFRLTFTYFYFTLRFFIYICCSDFLIRFTFSRFDRWLLSFNLIDLIIQFKVIFGSTSLTGWGWCICGLFSLLIVRFCINRFIKRRLLNQNRI